MRAQTQIAELLKIKRRLILHGTQILLVTWPSLEKQSLWPPAIFLGVIIQLNICLGKFVFCYEYWL